MFVCLTDLEHRFYGCCHSCLHTFFVCFDNGYRTNVNIMTGGKIFVNLGFFSNVDITY